MPILDQIFETAKARQAKVVFPERDEPRVARACDWLINQGAARPIGLSDPTEAQLASLIEARGVKEPIARRMLQKPLFRAAAMVACGEADAMVAGALAPTRRVIEAASIAIGPASGGDLPSSFFLMVFPDGREMVWADCAVHVAPDAAQLAAIAKASEATARKLLGAARVAMLSFSTGQSGAGASVDLVRQAAEISGFGGPLQADAALDATIAAQKGLGAGDANVLIFPNLDAGNIAYKLAQELAGAQAIGPILQGFARPVGDLSRGASPDDIAAVALTTIALG